MGKVATAAKDCFTATRKQKAVVSPVTLALVILLVLALCACVALVVLLCIIKRGGTETDVATGPGSTTLPGRYTVSQECQGADTQRYRRQDGRCNHPSHAPWGASGTPQKRLLPPLYYNGSLPRRLSRDGLSPLPSPRQVSLLLSSALPEPQTSEGSDLLTAWGQFISHDLSHTPFNTTALKECCSSNRSQMLNSENGGPCIPINHVPGDQVMECIPLTRSLPHVVTGGAPSAHRSQINRMTSFLDGSAVYGATEDTLAVLKGQHGKMATAADDRLPMALNGDCRVRFPGEYCQAAGDPRVDVFVGLGLLHTLFVREHNRLVTALTSINPHWTDEVLFQEARRIVAAELQHVTYLYALPPWLGPGAVATYDLDPGNFRYDPDLDPTVANVFSTAAFRFGHSQLKQEVKIGSSRLAIQDTLKRPHFVQQALTSVLLGLASAGSDAVDCHFARGVTDHLFESSNASRDGTDLLAINVQRGRDHGLPPFNAWREYCGLPALEGFHSSELYPNDLAAVYSHIDDLDPYVGLVLERHLGGGGMMGPTLSCLVAQQFRRLKFGDRFFYETVDAPQAFSPDQLAEIRKITLSRILCDNLPELGALQRDVFKVENTLSNPRVPCDSIPGLDIQRWLDPS